MGKVIKKALVIGAVVAGAAFGGPIIGSFARALLINGALSIAARALTGKKRGSGVDTTQTMMIRSTTAPREIVYGECRKSGLVFFAKTAGASNENYDLVVALAGHQCEDITDVWFDDVRIPDADINPTTGVIGGSTKYAGKALIFRYLGTSTQAASTLLDSTYTEWTTSHQAKGVAYIHVRFIGDGVYASGVPQNVYALVKGKRVYDPRLDSTNGGTGTHRTNDATTWAWSNNPILCAADYTTGGSITFDVTTPDQLLGFGARANRINWPSVIAAADICDESISPVVYNDTPQDRYLCDGVLSTGDALDENLKKILSSCAGQRVRQGGAYYFYAGAYDTPAVTLTDRDMIGAYSVTPKASTTERYNTVRATYINSGTWQPTEARPRADAAYITADGGELPLDIELPMTVNGYRAQRLAELSLRQSRNQCVVVGDFALTAFQVQLWTTMMLTSTRLGYAEKVFRCIGWELQPTGLIRLTLREESSAAYTDIAGSEEAFGDYLQDFSTDSDPTTPADAVTAVTISSAAAGNLPITTTAGAVTTLAVGADGLLLMTDAAQATKMRWGPASPAAGDIFTVGGASGVIERLAVGGDGTVLTADSGEDKGVKWATPSSGGGFSTYDPAAVYEYVFDFDAATAQASSDEPWSKASSGTGAVVTDNDADGDHPGIWTLETGTTSAGFAAVCMDSDFSTDGLNGYKLNSDALTVEWLIRVPTLPSAAQDFEFHVGLASLWTSAATPARRALAIVRWDGAAVKWRLETRHAGTSTTADHSAGPTANTWHHVKLTCTTSQVTLDVDGTNILTNTTNIPTTGVTLGAIIVKSVGSTNRTGDLDLTRVRKTFSTPRF